MPDIISGLLLLDKPMGFSSFDCVRMARRVLKERRIGHCGTLDPMAEGVLVLLFGAHTSRQREFLTMDKQYWFRCEFGRETDSGDKTGKQTQTQPYAHITRERLEAVVASFLGDQWQTPPKVSAIKYKGKRLYEWARKGIEVPRPPRQITIYSFEILSFTGQHFEARITCSRGTYVRSLAEDVARKLDTVGTLDALIRERVGTYRREDALHWDRLCKSSREELLRLAHA